MRRIGGQERSHMRTHKGKKPRRFRERSSSERPGLAVEVGEEEEEEEEEGKGGE